MNEIKVSVIIPVYNSEKYLGDSLKDITSQTLKEIEIICVDDGSEDSSSELLYSWAEKDPRISVIRQQNQTAGAARNRGLKEARGKYVIFWDADDRFNPKALELLYQQAERAEADICVCAACQYDAAKESRISTNAYLKKQFLPKKTVFNKYDIPEHIFDFTSNVPWNKLYRRDFILEHHLEYQVIRQANDTYFVIMALYFADKITRVNRSLISYRINNTISLSGKASDTVLCAYDSWVYTRDALKQQPDYALVQKSFMNRAISGFFHSLNIQTNFAGYEKLYNKLVAEGFEAFGMTDAPKSDFYKSWMHTDMELMNKLSAGDFLVQKAMQRRLTIEKMSVWREKIKALPVYDSGKKLCRLVRR